MKDGMIQQTGERLTLRYERNLDHPVAEVWRAITDPAEIERWTGIRPELDLRPCGEYVSHHGPDRHRVVDHVVRLDPPYLFEHTFWETVNPSALVTWKLVGADGGTLLVLTHALDHDDIAQAAATLAQGYHPVTIMSRNAAGWHRMLDRLEATVDGRELAWSTEDQERLRERYAGRFAAVVGQRPS